MRAADYSGRRGRDSHASDIAVSEPGAAAGRCIQFLHGRECTDGGERRHDPFGAADQRGGGNEVRHVHKRQRRIEHYYRHLRSDRDPDLATVDIQNRVNTAQGRLPAAVKAVGITTAKTSQNFVFGAAVLADNNKYSTLFLSNYLDVYVKDSLKRIPGVADVIIFGERKYSMRLWLDPGRLAGRALTAPDVVNALSEQNVEIAAGQVGQQPAPEGQQYQISVRAVGRLSEPGQFDNIILKTNADGTLVRLKDVGRAELGAEDYSTDLQFDGQDAVGLGVTQLSTANALDVHKRALAELARLAKSFPPGMRYKVAFDTTDAVSESIRDVVFTVGAAILLVILVIFVFLGDIPT